MANSTNPSSSDNIENDNLTGEDKKLFDAVPKDGTSIGNKALRAALKWTEDEYWKIRDGLVERGYLSTGMGRGGSVYMYLAQVDWTDPPTSHQIYAA
jgi:hypothetical protein